VSNGTKKRQFFSFEFERSSNYVAEENIARKISAVSIFSRYIYTLKIVDFDIFYFIKRKSYMSMKTICL